MIARFDVKFHVFLYFTLMQTLADENIQLYLCYIRPTAVLGCITKFEPVPYRLSPIWLKCFIKETRFMGVQIVHYQRYLFCLLAVACNLFILRTLSLLLFFIAGQ